MIRITYLIFFFLLLASGILCAQNTLTIQVENVESSEGYIAVGLYNSADNFLEIGKVYKGAFETSVKGTTVIEIPNLPSGKYAVSIFHDENGDKELDTNFLGIPKEPVAFSNAKMKLFGPPDFEDCTFEIAGDFKIVIPFE